MSSAIRLNALEAFLSAIMLWASIGTMAAESLTRVTDSLSVTESGLLVVDLSEDAFQAASLFDLSNKTLRAVPSSTGYSTEILESRFINSEGQQVSPGQNPIQLTKFAFNFSGQLWDSFYINADNTVSFGAADGGYNAFSPYTDLINLLTSNERPPLIAPLFRLVTNGEVKVNQFDDRIAITWHVTPTNLQTNKDIFAYLVAPEINTFQLVLFASGVIEINYKQLTIEDGIVGILPKRVPTPVLVEALPGTYIREPYQNEFHQGDLTLSGGKLKWRNLAGVEWELALGTLSESRLATIGSPYGDSSETDFTIEVCDDGRIKGFRFLNELYIRQSSSPCSGTSIDLSTRAASDVDQRPFEVFHYTKPINLEFMSCAFIPFVGDQYDFILGFTPFRLDKPLAGSGMRVLRNAIDGIGYSRFDLYSTSICSDSRLQASPVVPWYLESPLGRGASTGGLDQSYDFFLSMAGHELSHRWMAGVDAIVDGKLIELQDSSCNCHWREGLQAPAAHPWKEDKQASAMGGGYWQDNNDGTFTRIADAFFVPASGYSYLDLYLMGLVQAEEVPDFFLIEDLKLINSDNPDRPIYSGSRIDITVEDVIASAGPRSVSFIESQKQFNTAFVLFLEPGSNPDTADLEKLATLRARFSEYWSYVTGGVSSMNQESLIKVEQPSFSNQSNILTVPVLSIGSDSFRLEFSVSSTEPLELTLSAFQQLDTINNIATSSFTNGVLTLPSLRVGEANYRVEFTLVNDNPVTLRLVSATVR